MKKSLPVLPFLAVFGTAALRLGRRSEGDLFCLLRFSGIGCSLTPGGVLCAGKAPAPGAPRGCRSLRPFPSNASGPCRPLPYGPVDFFAGNRKTGSKAFKAFDPVFASY